MLETQSSFLPVLVTGTASASIGDQIGNSLAEVLVWLVDLSCHCTPPLAVVSAFHTLTVATVVALAYIVHYRIVKTQTPS